MVFVFQIIAFELGVAKSHNLEQDTETALSKIFAVPNFGNTLAMTIILVLKMFKI